MSELEREILLGEHPVTRSCTGREDIPGDIAWSWKTRMGFCFLSFRKMNRLRRRGRPGIVKLFKYSAVELKIVRRVYHRLPKPLCLHEVTQLIKRSQFLRGIRSAVSSANPAHHLHPHPFHSLHQPLRLHDMSHHPQTRFPRRAVQILK